MRLAAAWNRFFFADASPVALASFRILLSLALAVEVGTTRTRSTMAIVGGFHVPYASWIPLIAPGLYEWVHVIQYPLILALAVGYRMRLACLGLLLLQGWVFFADATNFRNHPYFFLLLLGLLACSPADRALSLRAWRSGDLLGRSHPLVVQRLIQLQVCIVYLFAGLHKIHPYYFTGEVIRPYMVRMAEVRAPLISDLFGASAAVWIRGLVDDPAVHVPAALLTVGLELALPFLLWWPRVRPLAIAVGVAFHLGIAFLLAIYVFSLAMISSYLLFLEPARVRHGVATLVSRLPASARSGIRSPREE